MCIVNSPILEIIMFPGVLFTIYNFKFFSSNFYYVHVIHTNNFRLSSQEFLSWFLNGENERILGITRSLP